MLYVNLEIQYRKPCQLLLLLYSENQRSETIIIHVQKQKFVWLGYSTTKRTIY